MSDKDDLPEQDPQQAGVTQTEPPMFLATVADLDFVDIDAPLADFAYIDEHAMAARYWDVLRPKVGPEIASETPAFRIYSLIGSLIEMGLVTDNPNNPYLPHIVWMDGRQTPVPENFRPKHVPLIAEMAKRAKSPALRARLADVGWFLNRVDGELGRTAVLAYLEIVQLRDSGVLKSQYRPDEGALSRSACEILKRAVQIARVLGWEKAEAVQARTLITELRERAFKTGTLSQFCRYCELDLGSAISSPSVIADSVVERLNRDKSTFDPHLVDRMWSLAARAYGAAKMSDRKNDCLTTLADFHEAYAAEIEAKGAQAMLVAHWMTSAISRLHGVPGSKDRRKKLRHKLIDIQAQIPEELTSFRKEIDVTDTARDFIGAFEKIQIKDALIAFARMNTSPMPQDLIEAAKHAMAQSPLLAMMPVSAMDRHGKTTSKSAGATLDKNENAEAISSFVTRIEGIRRFRDVLGKIEPVRQLLMERCFLSEDVFQELLALSPFVDPVQLRTISRGVAKFFQGDFICAAYILFPTLENSLRHRLRAVGHDVSKLDDATGIQEDRTLSSLIESMRGELGTILPEEMIFEMDNLFTAKLGPSLRHALSHGLLHDDAPQSADVIYGCWFIYRIYVAVLFPIKDRIELPIN